MKGRADPRREAEDFDTVADAEAAQIEALARFRAENTANLEAALGAPVARASA
jgi:hypothetical protein